eukprot:GFUD01117021.1.p1 GENE.GFUD01117021.1~~GFUD01117021.1.p1  ORF type:complete len:106 (+),score=30.18 GFUD01117021.1:324-641(+)
MEDVEQLQLVVGQNGNRYVEMIGAVGGELLRGATVELRSATAEQNCATAKLTSATAELRSATAELRSATAELNCATAELRDLQTTMEEVKQLVIVQIVKLLLDQL